VVRTDHNSLVWLCHFKEIDGQLARWLEALAQYDFKIVHRKGSKHGNADGLSRRSCTDCRHCEKAELMEDTVRFVQAAVEWIQYKDIELCEGRRLCPNKESEWEEGEEHSMEAACAARGSGDAGAREITLDVENTKSVCMDKEGNQEGEQEVENGKEQKEKGGEKGNEEDAWLCKLEITRNACEEGEGARSKEEGDEELWRGRAGRQGAGVGRVRAASGTGSRVQHMREIEFEHDALRTSLGSRQDIIREQQRIPQLKRIIENLQNNPANLR
jgi:hypothetical protein